MARKVSKLASVMLNSELERRGRFVMRAVCVVLAELVFVQGPNWCDFV